VPASELRSRAVQVSELPSHEALVWELQSDLEWNALAFAQREVARSYVALHVLEGSLCVEGSLSAAPRALADSSYAAPQDSSGVKLRSREDSFCSDLSTPKVHLRED
jgi:hypothetical protein